MPWKHSKPAAAPKVTTEPDHTGCQRVTEKTQTLGNQCCGITTAMTSSRQATEGSSGRNAQRFSGMLGGSPGEVLIFYHSTQKQVVCIL